MDVIVDKKTAVLKKDFSFDYISENRLFLGRDGYTLNIAFPLKDCPDNIEIFGRINRIDVAKKKVSFECSIVDGRVSLYGILSVVKISDIEVECQFSEGRCAQVVADPFEDTFISSLNLGRPSILSPSAISPSQAWKSIDNGAEEVALPWINESYPTAPNNWVYYSSGFKWDEEVYTLSWQPYLLVIAKRICEAIGYSYDFSEWEQSEMRHLIICNTLPGALDLPEYAYALPEWTVSEFFEKLELLLMCEFNFDHQEQSVKMQFSKNVLDSIKPVLIDEIVDSYDAQVDQNSNKSCDYIASKRLAFAQCDHAMWNYYSCDWFVNSFKFIKRYNTLHELIEANKRRDDKRGSVHRVYWGETMGSSYDPRFTTVDALMYAEDVDTYFVFRSIGTEIIYTPESNDDTRPVYSQIYVLQPINVFGSGSTENENSSSEEIDFAPVCISDTYIDDSDDMGYMMYLKPSSSGASSASTESSASRNGVGDGSYDRPGGGKLDSYDPAASLQPCASSIIANGSSTSTSGAYDRIYVAFWNGVWNSTKSPYPIIDQIVVDQDWTYQTYPGLSMRINTNAQYSSLSQLPKIKSLQKFKFSWLSREIPNIRAIFYIKGKRYLCEKITATFTENGMSQLLKGEFYLLADD